MLTLSEGVEDFVVYCDASITGLGQYSCIEGELLRMLLDC